MHGPNAQKQHSIMYLDVQSSPLTLIGGLKSWKIVPGLVCWVACNDLETSL